jgi:hypothetical protein
MRRRRRMTKQGRTGMAMQIIIITLVVYHREKTYKEF